MNFLLHSALMGFLVSVITSIPFLVDGITGFFSSQLQVLFMGY
jgi:hypothetical protein